MVHGARADPTSDNRVVLYFHFASRVFHPNTRAHVRLLGPCFKTGRMTPFHQHLEQNGGHGRQSCRRPNAHTPQGRVRARRQRETRRSPRPGRLLVILSPRGHNRPTGYNSTPSCPGMPIFPRVFSGLARTDADSPPAKVHPSPRCSPRRRRPSKRPDCAPTPRRGRADFADCTD